MLMLLQKLHCLLLAVAMFTGTVFSQNIPNQIKDLYKDRADYSISDEFNGKRTDNSVDLNKWDYRRTKNSGPSTKYVREQYGYVSCKGIKADRRAGGIVSKEYKKHGFYTLRWRARGIDPAKRSAWHPSVWSAIGNGQLPGSLSKRQVPNIGDGWLEIDMIEFENFSTTNTHWSADAPARVRVPDLEKLVKVNDADGLSQGFAKAVMIPRVDTDFNEWQIYGLEYATTYLQMWKRTSTGWEEQGRRVVFNDDTPSIGSIPNVARSSMFWYIGNLFLDQNPDKIKEYQITNSAFDVDWFRYYPRNLSSSKELKATTNKGNALNSISPNPATSNTSASYSIASNSNTVELVIYDLNGKKIASQIESNLNAGNHTTAIDIAGLSPNVYLCKLIIDGVETNTLKLIVN